MSLFNIHRRSKIVFTNNMMCCRVNYIIDNMHVFKNIICCNSQQCIILCHVEKYFTLTIHTN